ncbi:hypothetical protein NKJ36_28005 [Mesorhizobium sp. M0142]|uniref:hypothetical protein n=1 Tax=Mesorhizobium sp. M0142 TaxID=2956894 RepID=UPI003338FC4A
MFAKALKIAGSFTWPLLIAYKTVSGRTFTAIATITIINKDGWFLTAGHNIREWQKIVKECDRTQLILRDIDVIENDSLIDKEAKEIHLSKLPLIQEMDKMECSISYGLNHNITAKNLNFSQPLVSDVGYDPLDLAVGRLEPFNPEWVANYPIFKDPDKNFFTGTSLCKLGFPLHGVETHWNDETGEFELPRKYLPLTYFPLDGIFTRNIVYSGNGPIWESIKFPVMSVEMSTPGLRGQSGGPIFDTDGRIWAIQSRTLFYSLGFEAPIPAKDQTVHQFLSVGIGVHPSTIFGFLKDSEVRCAVSED